jgi:hypothetical protein
MSPRPQLQNPASQPGDVECLIRVPALGYGQVPAVATNLDRRGAVVHLRQHSAWVALPELEAGVEVLVRLSPHGGRPGRLMHCQGVVKQRSMDKSHRLWLVLQFFQIQFEGPEMAPGSGTRIASLPDNRGGDRDPAIVGGSQPGETPQPNLINQGE